MILSEKITNFVVMSQFQINYLGCGSATPTLRHLPSCQVIDFRDNLFMVDCGECAQLSMRRQRLKFSRLGHIFLSHLHGDHCLGLPGLISTLALTGKEGGEITIHTTPEGERIFRMMFNAFCHDKPFNLRFATFNPEESQVLYESNSLIVKSFPLYHRVPCSGFIFSEKPKKRHLRGDAVRFYNVPIRDYNAIKEGADFTTPEGRVIPNEVLTRPADKALSYAYCSDTTYDPGIARSVEGVDTIYHEATYTDEYAAKAAQRGHSTASQAARIAIDAGANRLVLGHFSKRYTDESQHLKEAQAIFPNTITAYEGLALDL